LHQAWRGEGAGVNGLELLREFVKTKTLKETAYILDEQPSGLAHELAEHDYREPKARLLVLAVMRDKSRRIIRWLCHLAGGAFVELPRMSADEELRLTKDWLRNNPSIEKAWKDEVHGGRP